MSLESKPANVEGVGAYLIRDLVRNALRMRPDRIVVGECRGGEALDMIQAMNTGHAGSMTTVHANSAEEVIERLELLMLMGAELPMSSIHRQIASAVDIIVHIDRLPTGKRVVTQVSEVTGVHPHTTDVMITDNIEARYQAELNPDLVAVNPDRPFTIDQKAYLLPRGSGLSGEVNAWLQSALADGTFDQILHQWIG